MKTEKRRTGDSGERAARRYLRLHGYRIIDKNATLGHLETDIIAKKHGVLVFCEVKTRTLDPDGTHPYGTPADSVGDRKRDNLLRFVSGYLPAHPEYASLQPRLDIIEVYADTAKRFKVRRLVHHENAINYFGRR